MLCRCCCQDYRHSRASQTSYTLRGPRRFWGSRARNCLAMTPAGFAGALIGAAATPGSLRSQRLYTGFLSVLSSDAPTLRLDDLSVGQAVDKLQEAVGVDQGAAVHLHGANLLVAQQLVHL